MHTHTTAFPGTLPPCLPNSCLALTDEEKACVCVRAIGGSVFFPEKSSSVYHGFNKKAAGTIKHVDVKMSAFHNCVHVACVCLCA